MRKHQLPPRDTIPQQSVDQYLAHGSELSILLNDFLLKYLNSLNAEFNGDIILAIVLGELAHHNISPFLKQGRMRPSAVENKITIESAREFLMPSNPFSISESTGIPRETVRRKFEELVRCGFAEQVSPRGYIITPQVTEHFMFGFNVRLFEGARLLSEQFQTILRGKLEPLSGHDTN